MYIRPFYRALTSIIFKHNRGRRRRCSTTHNSYLRLCRGSYRARSARIYLYTSLVSLIHRELDLPKGWVKCPICNTRVKEQSINAHIDNGCQSPPSISSTINSKRPTAKKKPSDDAKNQWNKLFSGKAENPGPKTSKAGGKGKEREKSM